MSRLILSYDVTTISLEKIRACPICPQCGSKKFDRLKTKETIVKCVKCGKELII